MLVRSAFASRYSNLFRYRILILREYRRRADLGSRRSHIPILNNSAHDNKEIYIGGKDPNDVANRLKKLGLQELKNDGKEAENVFLRYLEVINPKFKQTTKNLNRLRHRLQSEELDDNSKYIVLFDYLLNEMNLELQRYNKLGPDKILEQQLSGKDAEVTVDKSEEQIFEDTIFNDLFNTLDSEEVAYFPNTNMLFKVLIDIQIRKEVQLLPLEKLVEIFELSKLLPFRQWRLMGIFLSAKLLYSTGKVRMDPVNESFYINSLMFYGFYKDAYQLFVSNQSKVNERWWNEIGMMILLIRNNLRQFDRLMKETDQKFESYPYISPKVLKLAIKKYIKIENNGKVNELVSRLFQMIGIYGLKENHTLNELNRPINFRDESDANNFLNKSEPLTQHDFVSIINYFIQAKNTDMVSKLINRFLSYPNTSNNYAFLITETKLNLLKDFASLRQLLEKNNTKNLQEFESAFNKIRNKYNVKSPIYQKLFFDNIHKLISNYPLATLVNESIESALLNDKPTDEVTKSKNYNALMKLMLKSGNEDAAMEILNTMADSLKSQASTLRIPQVSAHHFATFIEYYIIESTNDGKKSYDKYKAKVGALINQMNSLGIPYNSTLLSQLLMFYRKLNDTDRCFQIINSVLSEDVDDTIKHPLNGKQFQIYYERNFTSRLYMEIWKTYYCFYSLLSLELVGTDVKSNYGPWKANMRKKIKALEVKPKHDIRWIFRKMIHEDNVLLNKTSYKIIISTFVKRRDWDGLAVILTSMVDLHGLLPDKEMSYYILTGIRKERIVIETQRLLSTTKDMSFLEARSIAINNVTKLIKLHKKRPQDVTYDHIISEIMNFLEYKNPYDPDHTQTVRAFEEVDISMNRVAEYFRHVNKK